MIAGVGYPDLSDLSVGPYMVKRLREMEWDPGVEIDNWSFGPVAVAQRLEDRPGFYDRIIFISAVERGREPGDVHAYQWQHELPDPEEIQIRIGEAIMGVISLDNLLVVTEHFRTLPQDVLVIEVEPENLEWGEEFTPRVQAAIPQVIELVRKHVGNGNGNRS